MIDPESHEELKQTIKKRIEADKDILTALRQEARPLRSNVRRIQPRTTTSISLVATDGGNNTLQFDPFLVQLVRVVDSSNNEYCLDAVSPTTDVTDLSARQFMPDGSGKTALGRTMIDLGVTSLLQLSPVIRDNSDGGPISPSWVQVYRELVEWAILYDVVNNKEFGTDTLVVFDGLLRRAKCLLAG